MIQRLLYIAFCLSTIFIAAPITLNGQSNRSGQSGWSVMGSWGHGRILRHNDRFRPEVTEPSDIWELHLAHHLAGTKSWHQRTYYPVVGLSFLHARFGDADIFGEAYGVLSSVMFQTRFKRWCINYRLGTGLAYLTRFYHPVTNSTHNVIGSHVNNVTQLMVGAEYYVHRQLHATLSLGLTHFSNGRTQTPNLGINIPTYGFGLRYMPQLPVYQRDTITNVLSYGLSYSRGAWAQIGIKVGQGIQEGDQFGGPKYPVYVCQLYASKRLSPQWQLHLGMEIDYYSANYYLGIQQGLYTPDEAAAIAVTLSPYLAGELLLGRVSLYGGLGLYAHNKSISRGILPTKVGLQYYVTSPYRRVGHQLYVGVYLKSHFAVADYTELGLGYLF